MPGPVEERLAVAFVVDDLAGGGIDRLAGDARRERPRVPVAWAWYRTLNRWRKRSSGPFAGSPPVTHKRPRDVRAVAAQRAADVEDDRLAGLDHAVRGLVVGRGGVRAGADDREIRPDRGPRRRAARGPRAATSASVRPTRCPAAIRATTRSAAWAASVSSAISSASLIDAQRRAGPAMASANRSPAGRRPGTRAGAAPAGRPRRAIRGPASRPPAAASRPATMRVRRRRSRPRSRPSRPAAAQARCGGRRLEPRDDEERRAARPAMTSIVSRSSGIAAYPVR